MQHLLRQLIIVPILLALSACGFHLRGDTNLPFETLHIAAGDYSSLATDLKRAIEAGSNALIVEQAAEAQAVLYLENEVRDKQILSLSGGGKVREYQLRYRISFRLVSAKGAELIPGGEIFIKRDFAFNDTQILAKESEEALLYRDMQNDAVQQMMRRLAAAKAELP